MQLDFQQFLMKLEKLTDIRPIPDKEFVETYIKAYYLTENDMERWIKEHRVRVKLAFFYCLLRKFTIIIVMLTTINDQCFYVLKINSCIYMY